LPRTLAVQFAMRFQCGNSTAVGQTIVAVGQTTVACRLIDRTCFITYDGKHHTTTNSHSRAYFLGSGRVRLTCGHMCVGRRMSRQVVGQSCGGRLVSRGWLVASRADE
jgi:hypothetical protein